jgi:excisionase family DNA binding protein
MTAEKAKPIDALAYTTTQAAQVTGRSHTRIKKAIRERELTARKDGRATLIERAELQRWLAAMPTVGRAPEQVAVHIATENSARSMPSPKSRPPPSGSRSRTMNAGKALSIRHPQT